jgi:hypothetical protein
MTIALIRGVAGLIARQLGALLLRQVIRNASNAMKNKYKLNKP